MKYRRSECDVPMPDSIRAYWMAWNAHDLDDIPLHLQGAVRDDVEWNDPRDSFTGLAALEAAMRSLRKSKPDYRFVIASEIDSHHDRYRYRWDMVRGSRTLMEGLDIVTVAPDSGLITRVDGFFGYPTPIEESSSGVPADLRRREVPKAP